MARRSKELLRDRAPGALAFYTTGRTLWHFHTRTKTGRAGRHGIGDGQDVEVETPRGRTRGKARIGGVRSGVVLLPFHCDGANELTRTAWDPASKQPPHKVGKCRLR